MSTQTTKTTIQTSKAPRRKRKQRQRNQQPAHPESKVWVNVNSAVSKPKKTRNDDFTYGTKLFADSLFNGYNGISRGVAFGADLTALGRWRGYVEISIPANGQCNLGWVPSGNHNIQWLRYITDTAANLAGSANPWVTTPVSIAQYTVTAPMTNTYSNAFRIVHGSLEITNVTNVLEQGGSIVAGHISTIGQSGNAFTFQGPTTITQLENRSMTKRFPGTTPVSYHYYPNSDETEVQPNDTTLLRSGAQIVITAPNKIQTYVVRWSVGYDYIPHDNFQPLVQTGVPRITPDELSRVNQIVARNWDPLLVGTTHDSKALTQRFVGNKHSWTQEAAHHGGGLQGSPVADGKRNLEEEKEFRPNLNEIILPVVHKKHDPKPEVDDPRSPLAYALQDLADNLADMGLMPQKRKSDRDRRNETDAKGMEM